MESFATKLERFWPMLLSGLITSGRLGIQSVALRQTIRAIDQAEPILAQQLDGWIPPQETLRSLTRLRELGNSADASIAQKLLPDGIPPWPALRAIAGAYYKASKEQPEAKMAPNVSESNAITAVINHPREILKRLFHPSPLVQAGWGIDGRPELRTAFDAAEQQYKNRQYSPAKQAFLDISDAAESRYLGSGRTALMNAAACVG
jgi:TolA-binding protein